MAKIYYMSNDRPIQKFCTNSPLFPHLMRHADVKIMKYISNQVQFLSNSLKSLLNVECTC